TRRSATASRRRPPNTAVVTPIVSGAHVYARPGQLRLSHERTGGGRSEIATRRAASTQYFSEARRIIRTPFRAPQANAVAERFVRTARSECLDWLVISTHGTSGIRARMSSSIIPTVIGDIEA